MVLIQLRVRHTWLSCAVALLAACGARTPADAARGPTLVVVVRDSSTDAPVSGGRVALYRRSDAHPQGDVVAYGTDSASTPGHLRLWRPTRGEYLLEARRTGYGPGYWRVRFCGGGTDTVEVYLPVAYCDLGCPRPK
jgi:hypothetical protein